MSFEVDTGGFTTSQPQTLTPGASPAFAGLTISSMTAGSVLFAGTAGAVSQDNSNFFWDATNHRLGLANVTPRALLHVGTTAATAQTFNTFTDASNYENAYMGDWGVTANVATYGTGKAGTGSTRAVQFVVGGVQRQLINASGNIGFGIDPLTRFNVEFHASTDQNLGVKGPLGGSALTDGISLSSVNDANSANAPIEMRGSKFILSGGDGLSKLDYDVTTASKWTFSVAVVVPGAASPIITTSSAITSGAAAAVGTLTNAPTAGNPTKWIPINDNGTTRYLPAW